VGAGAELGEDVQVTNSRQDYATLLLNRMFGEGWLGLFHTVVLDAKKGAFFSEHADFIGANTQRWQLG
jgi:hypothetical protein